jgi:hypothetical protein
MKKILFSLIWIFACSGLILGSIGLYNFVYLPIYFKNHPIVQAHMDNKVKIAEWKEQIETVDGIESKVDKEDGRAAIVASFLEKKDKNNQSPLQPYDYYGQKLVEIADKHQLDFRLLPAILMQESNLCTKIPEGSYNCLGFGIHSGGVLHFKSYEANFERAARELRSNYVEEGRLTVSMIARKYTASVDQWTNAINQFMSEMKYNDRQKGIQKKTDSNVLEYVSDD